MEIVWFLLLTFLAAIAGGYVGNLSANYARKKRGERPISFWTGRPRAHKPSRWIDPDYIDLNRNRYDPEPAWGVIMEVSMVVYAKDKATAQEEAYAIVGLPSTFLTASLVDIYIIDEDVEAP